MCGLAFADRDDVLEGSKPILDAVHKELGVVPNMFRLIAQSAAAPRGCMANNPALTKTLDVTRERIGRRAGQRLRLLRLRAPEPRRDQPRGVVLNRKGEFGDVKRMLRELPGQGGA